VNPNKKSFGRAVVCLKLFGLCGLILAIQSAAGAWQMKQAPLMTQWAALVDTNNPLPEYPRPQLVRTNWLNLNGLWQFQPGATNDPVPTGQTLSSQILVPYPMESAISGVMQYSAFSWYRRTFTIPNNWSGQRIILHLDAVDWQATIYVNGQNLGVHKGGYDPFSFDITSYLNAGTNELIVQVYSPEDAGGQPRGKQTLYPGGIMYTSSSGIWQPVWLEPVDASGVNNLQIIPDMDDSRLRLTVNTYATNGVTVAATVLSNNVVVAGMTGNPQVELDIPVANPNLWSPENPFLYNLQISIIHNGVTNDSVTSYFGMRKISINVVNGVPQILLNNKSYFGMGPLDQGFWPDGIYTAPTDAALEYDLQQEKALGFNTVRKHIKVERQRWYYWADTLGLLVWQDMPSCNSYTGNPSPPGVNPVQFQTELTALVTNHWNSPCIIMWDIFNEGQGEAGSGNGVGQATTASLVQVVKTLDSSRLVNQASGGSYFGVGDVFDSHSYPDPGDPITTTQAPVDGEFGGIAWHVNGHLWNPALAGTGYLMASSIENISALYDGYIDEAVNFKPIANGGLNAAIYTQITDVENECNGLMTYDRLLKPDPTLVKISNQKAATGLFTVVTVVPTSQAVPQTWQWTTNTPAANWYATNFNPVGWSTGLAGFGTTDPNVTPNTPWSTPGYIYLRRTFNPGALTTQQISDLVFTVYHDEDAAIYINGVLAGSASGFSSTYVNLTMTPQGRAAIIPNGTNVLAVSCLQTTGGQFIDVGISAQTLVANTQTTPNDYLGYWPLDATNGVIAMDASGNGDNGLVNGASWNGSGQINGCLSFNGVNNYVQVSNPVSADFSIVFWVKTTQTSEAGQWYGGAGLVDGEVALATNDYGTALSGGKFAFGVGNPDTTIVSTSSINDGAWHQCVATRVQATGAMNLYVDGNWQAAGTGNTNSLAASGILRFGQIASGGGFFNGALDEIKIYSRALGGNEITALYNSSASPPGAPTNVMASTGNEEVILSWFTSAFGSGYSVSRATTSGGPYTVIGTTTSASYMDTNVANGSTYYYVISAVNTFGTSLNSSEVPATPFILAAWFAADVITGLVNGATVSTWTDTSGNSNNATQTVSILQPVYVTNGMNGLPVVRFNSTNSTCLTFNRPIQDDFTILLVYQSSQTNQGTGAAFFNGAGLVNGDQPGAQDDFGTSLNANGQVIVGTGNPDTSVNSGNGYNDGKPHVVTFERTESSGALILYVDGAQVATGTGGAESLTAPLQLYLGAVPSGGGFLSGDLAEVKIYSVALASTERIAQENALVHKWGITAPAMPSGVTAIAGNDQVQLDWNSYSAATYYNVKRATVSGGPYVTIASPVTNNFTDATVANGKPYYYVVSVVSPLGQSANSAEVGVLPLAPAVITWFKANNITGVANGAAVGSWSDASGNNYNATQATSGQQPKFFTNAINEMPVVRFNAANSTYLAFNRSVQNDFTIIIVYRCSQTNQGVGTSFWQGAALVNGDQPFTQNDFGTSINANGQVIAGTGNPDTSINSDGGYNDGNPHVVTFKRTQSAGALALYVDGMLAATGTGGTQALTAPVQMDLGAVPSDGGSLTGDIAEVKIFNTALSDLNRNVEENSLACKYGLNIGNPALASPTGLNGTPGNRQITLNWSGSSGAASYSLSSSTNLNGPFISLVTGLTTNSYTDASAVSGQTQYYVVSAANGCNYSANSSPLGVFLPKPILTLTLVGANGLNLSWPAWASDWGLYFATNLNPPVSWYPNTHAIGSNNGQFSVSLPFNSAPCFFRLTAP
jgi:fibronectin type 3 domain-containing protein